MLLPPEEGQPPWAAYPDADRDGKPDPIITEVRLRVENEKGETITRARLGQKITLVAVPELGGLELEPLTVRFHLVGPSGEAPVAPDPEIKDPGPVGTAPAVYRARYAFPEDSPETQVGDYEARVEVQLGGAATSPTTAPAVKLRVLGPRESTTRKVGRRVRHGLRAGGDALSRFGRRVAAGIASALDLNARPTAPGPKVLHQVQERASIGMAREATQAPGSPLTDKETLSPERAAALYNGAQPRQSMVVIPVGVAPPAPAAGGFRIGYLALQGLRPATASGPAPAGILVTARERPFVLYAMVLTATSGAAEGTLSLVGAEASSVREFPVKVRWYKAVPWPGTCSLRVHQQPRADSEGMVDVQVTAASPEGAVRLDLTLPIVLNDEP